MGRLKKLSAATVHCNTPDLLKRAIGSIREFYPDLPILVIDGSEPKMPLDLPFESVEVGLADGNIGHGPGMNLALNALQTDYVLLFDTDIVMKKPCLEKMLAMMAEETFGVGEVNYEEQSVYHVQFGGGVQKIPVLHPYFHIVQREEYFKYLPYVQNGGPVFLTALDIFSKKLSHRVLKKFPVREYIEHNWRGTRDVKPPDMYKGSVVLNKQHMERFASAWLSS